MLIEQIKTIVDALLAGQIDRPTAVACLAYRTRWSYSEELTTFDKWLALLTSADTDVILQEIDNDLVLSWLC